MKLRLIGIAAAISAILLGTASCITVNDELGGNFIPTDQTWDVYPCAPVALDNITMQRSDSLSGYSSTRFTLGSVKGEHFTSDHSTTFTLVPILDSMDFGKNPEVIKFHFSAVRDTTYALYDHQQRMLQNVYVHSLKKPLDTTIIYIGSLNAPEVLESYVELGNTITEGLPVYNGGDSLSFNFSKEYAHNLMNGINRWQALGSEKKDSLKYFLEEVPGIYLRTKQQTEKGGRINMFELPISTTENYYIDGNYAELKIRSEYDGVKKDTLFFFYFGPSELLTEESTSFPTQYALNACKNTEKEGFIEEWNAGNKEELYVEGGSGYKPVVTAKEIKRIVDSLILAEAPDVDMNSVVINKASIILPFNLGTNYEALDRYPMYLSPTVKISVNDGDYVSYAGLTDSSIESENQGEIDRSTGVYSPDMSHHIQEIVKLKRGEGNNVSANETEEEFELRRSKYDIWFLILHEEITETSSSSNSSYNDYYNNLLYNSYYNNMMYDPYGYGYGYGGYGYGGYGYGGYGYNSYSNYYNYLMMAQYASASSSTTTTSSSIELDKDRFYDAVLYGPGAGGDNIKMKPRIKITFSAPRTLDE